MLADDGGRSARPFIHDPAAYRLLAGSLGVDADAFEREIATRARHLEALGERGICDPPSVAAAVRDFVTDPPAE